MPELVYWRDQEAREGLIARGRAVRAKLADRLAGQEGVVAIEPDSGDYYVGATLGKANDAAHAHHPDQWVYFARLDRPDAEIVLPTW